MSKNTSERKGMPGQGEDLDRDSQQGHRKEGQKGIAPDWKKDKEHKGQGKENTGQHDDSGQQEHHRQGDPMGQKQKQMDPNKQRQPGGADAEETDERKKRLA
jgi:hypothetical protein